jgi:hypothetical protein
VIYAAVYTALKQVQQAEDNLYVLHFYVTKKAPAGITGALQKH